MIYKAYCSHCETETPHFRSLDILPVCLRCWTANPEKKQESEDNLTHADWHALSTSEQMKLIDVEIVSSFADKIVALESELAQLREEFECAIKYLAECWCTDDIPAVREQIKEEATDDAHA